MKIAICDDEPKYLEHLSALLTAYAERTGGQIFLNSFSSGDSLLRALEHHARFDVLFLDVLMPGLNGVEIAREIRCLNGVDELIFLTSSPDYALDAFSVKARDYLVKPLTEATLFCLMDELRARLDEEEQFAINTKKGLRRLLPDRIEYCEAIGHTLFWHLRSGVVMESADSMQNAEKALAGSGLFLRVHRSYLVNRHCIHHFNRNTSTIELEHMTCIPVPRAKFSELKKLYLNETESRANG